MPALLRRAGLPPTLFDEDRIFVNTAQLFAMWRAVAEMSGDPALGLKLGAELRFERSHPVAIAGVCSRSFGDALERLARYKQLTCPEEIRVQRKAGEASVEFHFVEATEPQPEILIDLGLSWILNVGRQGSDGEIGPMRLELIRPPKQRGLLEAHFGCPVRFKADRDALIFRARDLDLPFVTYNEELLQVIGTHLESELQARNNSMKVGEQVRETLRRSLAGKRPTVEGVARELGLGARTLQRRLTDAGLTFQQLLVETRRALAHHYLKRSNVELNEAAFLLGFEDANSFYRAFQIWEGTTPGAWRMRHALRAVESVVEDTAARTQP